MRAMKPKHMATDESSYAVRMEELTWPEYEERLASSVVFLPIGSIEQHGPHMPLNVDVVIPEELSIQVAEQVGGLVAPSFRYGYRSQPKSGGGQEFVGTLNLKGETLTYMVRDILSELYKDGAEQVVLVNGHYENEYFIREGIDLHREQSGGGEYMIASWWEMISDTVMDEVFEPVPGGFPGWPAEHAAITETALMLHFRPELVHQDRIADDQAERAPDYVMKPAPDDFIPESGSFYKSTHASQEMGRRIAEDVIDAMVDAVESEW